MRSEEDLTRCVGYRVDTHDGRIGSVATVLPRAGRRGGAVLVVRSDFLSCMVSAIPFDRVEAIDADERRIRLRKEIAETMREAARSDDRDRIVSRA